MNERQFSRPSPDEPSQRDGAPRRTRRLAGLVLGTTLLGAMATSTLVDAAPSSARQIERRALDAAPPGPETSSPRDDGVDAGDAREVEPAHRSEVLTIDCVAPGAVAGHRVHIGCSWTLPTKAPVRQLTLWRSVDGAVRERVATFGWPFETSYRDVVPAGTLQVAYAIIGTDGAGELVARSRADVVRLPSTPRATTPTPAEPVPTTSTPTTRPPLGSTPQAATPTTVRPVPRVTTPTTLGSRPVRPDAPSVVVTDEPDAAVAASRTVPIQPSAASEAPAVAVGVAPKQRGDGG